jgi:hypothetical protein
MLSVACFALAVVAQLSNLRSVLLPSASLPALYGTMVAPKAEGVQPVHSSPATGTLQCIGAPVGSLSNLQVARVLSANESSSSLCSPSVTAAAFTVHQQQCTCSANLAVVYSRVSIGTVQIVPDLWSL